MSGEKPPLFFEPWKQPRKGVIVAGPFRVTVHPTIGDGHKKLASHIVACVNACTGIPTGALEAMPDEAKEFVARLAARQEGIS
jgi:hypothetical protein